MNYRLDERGSVIPESVVLTIKEVKRRGWLYGPMRHVPQWAQVAVQKHRDAYDLASARSEMEARYRTGHWRRDPDPGRQPAAVKAMFERLQPADKLNNNSDTNHVDPN